MSIKSSFDRIPPFPEIPEELRLAARSGKLMPFIGAGVSQLGGCPGWDSFANSALKFFLDEGNLTYAEHDQICRLPARVKLSLALDFENRFKKNINFELILQPQDSLRDIGQRAYSGLAQIASTFVTTNYDEWLSLPTTKPLRNKAAGIPAAIPVTGRRPIYLRNEIDVNVLDYENAVIHIHGSVRDRKGMVLTTTEYLDLYASHKIGGGPDQENRFLTFLEDLFRLRSVLFIGYGLAELEILEYVVQKAGSKMHAGADSEPPRHFVVQGFFSHEIELAHALEAYYRRFGIGLLPFSRDDRDWLQLVEVIEYFAREIPSNPILPSQKRRDMEELFR